MASKQEEYYDPNTDQRSYGGSVSLSASASGQAEYGSTSTSPSHPSQTYTPGTTDSGASECGVLGYGESKYGARPELGGWQSEESLEGPVYTGSTPPLVVSLPIQIWGYGVWKLT